MVRFKKSEADRFETEEVEKAKVELKQEHSDEARRRYIDASKQHDSLLEELYKLVDDLHLKYDALKVAMGALLQEKTPEEWRRDPCCLFAMFLAFRPNDPLAPLDRGIAFITTLLKDLLTTLDLPYGWRDLPAEVSVSGMIVQAAESTDGFLTLDIEVESITLGDHACDLDPAPCIRTLCGELFSRSVRVACDEKIYEDRGPWESRNR